MRSHPPQSHKHISYTHISCSMLQIDDIAPIKNIVIQAADKLSGYAIKHFCFLSIKSISLVKSKFIY